MVIICCLKLMENLEKRQNLWRYMDLAKFVYLANTGTLWLARADTFRDAPGRAISSEMRRFIEKPTKNLAIKIILQLGMLTIFKISF